ncbi:MAG: FimV/HubP family polar landmark protein, partial [Steroidobacteraceae bacterium]
GSETPTLVAGLDEHSRALMARAAERQSSEEGELKVTETGTWHFDDTVLAQDGLAGHAAPHGKPSGAGGDLADTSRLVALQSGSDVDFEIGDAPVAKPAGEHDGVDLDVGAATVPDAAFAATQRLDADELPMPDLDPATMSEVGTKLDLARAYMDMGDPEGARNILDEVLTEGSSTQKQEAERLIASLP